mgnify:FL=1|jgi:hypothetical protein
MLRNTLEIEPILHQENIIILSALFTTVSIVLYFIYNRKDTPPDWKIYTVYLPPSWCMLVLFQALILSSNLLVTILMITVFTSIVFLSSICYKQDGMTVKVSNILLANILYMIIDLTAAHILTLN